MSGAAQQSPRPSAQPAAPQELDAVDAAVARLVKTRLQLRALTVDPNPARRAADGSDDEQRTSWWQRLVAQQPALHMMSEHLARWLAAQPWSLAAQTAGDEACKALAPWVRRHPVAAVGLAGAAGAVLMWARPWRWTVVRTAALPAAWGVVDSLSRHLAKAPWAAVLAWLMASMPTGKTARDAPPSTPGAPPAPAARWSKPAATDRPEGTGPSPMPGFGQNAASPHTDTDEETDGAMRWFFGGTPPPPPDAPFRGASGP